jgi:sulfite reductase (NADPH) flavoprotein alpha-component
MAGFLASKGYVHTSEIGGGETPTATVPVVILFGSQTGTAEKLAKQIAKQSKTQGCNARVLDAAEHAKVDWSKETNLLIVTSTYGDGDMPDNAQAFWDWLQTDAAIAMAHLQFSVLALGDTNYEQFCAAGKKMDARLEKLGAKRIHPLADCDLDYEAKANDKRSRFISGYSNF